MSGVAGEARQVRLRMRSTQVHIVANRTGRLNLLGRRRGKTSNLIRVTSFRMISAGTMAALATVLGDFCPFQGVQMRSSCEALVGIFMAALTDFSTDIPAGTRLLEAAWRLRNTCSDEKSDHQNRTEPRKKANRRHGLLQSANEQDLPGPVRDARFPDKKSYAVAARGLRVRPNPTDRTRS
jgi:hypothetical protein